MSSTQELVRQLRRHAKKLELDPPNVKAHESKGSHRRIYFNGKNTTVPWTSNLTKGTRRAILKQLGVDVNDFIKSR